MLKKLLLSSVIVSLTSCVISTGNPSTGASTNPSSSSNPKPSSITTEGLISYLPFNGKAEDESLNKSEVYVEGEVKLTSDKNGKANSAYEFNNTNSYIEVKQDINPSKHKQLTMMAWVKPTEFGDTDIKTIISNDDGEFDRTLLLDHRGENKGWSAFSGDCEVFGSITPVELNKWSFVAVSYDQDQKTVDLYVNGNKFSKTGCTIGESQNKFFRVGINPGFSEPFSGSIDEVRVYSRKLTDSEVDSIFKAN